MSVRHLPILGLVLLGLAIHSPARGEEEREADRPDLLPTGEAIDKDITSQQLEAIEKGLGWLAENQNLDGSWNEEARSNVAVTSLVLLSLMANGNTETRGKHQLHVRKGVRYLLESVIERETADDRNRVGYIAREEDRQSRMHGHGYATMTLALAYGMGDHRGEDKARFRRLLTSAVRRIEASQDDSGGWGYQPVPVIHEGSVTVCQIWALRASREAGIKVRREVIDKAIRYVERSHDPESGGFCYSLSERTRQTYALTAAALSTLFGLGEYGRRDMIERSVRYLKEHNEENYQRRTNWFFYGNLYAAQALWQASGTEWAAPYWREWWPRMRDALIQKQYGTGFWRHPGAGSTWGLGEAYSTAMATLILQVPLEVLPVFQR